MKNTKAKVATGATVVLLGGLGGLALSQGDKAPNKPVADKPMVRTKVIRRTIHVTKHAKPKHPVAAGAGVAGSYGGGSSGSYGSATTGASSPGASGTSSYSSSPVSTSSSGASSAPTGSGSGSVPVTTHTSGGGGGSEVEHDSGGGHDD